MLQISSQDCQWVDYHTARTKYLDTQTFSKPGVPDWQDFIREKNEHRDHIRSRAEKICYSNGHTLFPWTCMNSTLCRKCGRTVYLHNIHGSTDAPDIEGRAILQKCDVGFDSKDNFSEYIVQDYYGDTVI